MSENNRLETFEDCVREVMKYGYSVMVLRNGEIEIISPNNAPGYFQFVENFMNFARYKVQNFDW